MKVGERCQLVCAVHGWKENRGKRLMRERDMLDIGWSDERKEMVIFT